MSTKIEATMRRLGSLLVGVLILAAALAAQAQSDALQPVATMKQLMVDVIHPA